MARRARRIDFDGDYLPPLSVTDSDHTTAYGKERNEAEFGVDRLIVDSIRHMYRPAPGSNHVPHILHASGHDPLNTTVVEEGSESDYLPEPEWEYLPESEWDDLSGEEKDKILEEKCLLNCMRDSGEIRISALRDVSQEHPFAPQDMDLVDADPEVVPGLWPEEGFSVFTAEEMEKELTVESLNRTSWEGRLERRYPVH